MTEIIHIDISEGKLKEGEIYRTNCTKVPITISYMLSADYRATFNADMLVLKLETLAPAFNYEVTHLTYLNMATNQQADFPREENNCWGVPIQMLRNHELEVYANLKSGDVIKLSFCDEDNDIQENVKKPRKTRKPPKPNDTVSMNGNDEVQDKVSKPKKPRKPRQSRTTSTNTPRRRKTEYYNPQPNSVNSFKGFIAYLNSYYNSLSSEEQENMKQGLSVICSVVIAVIFLILVGIGNLLGCCES